MPKHSKHTQIIRSEALAKAFEIDARDLRDEDVQMMVCVARAEFGGRVKSDGDESTVQSVARICGAPITMASRECGGIISEPNPPASKTSR